MRKSVIVGVFALLLCSGCVTQSSLDFTEIAPITKAEMELTEKSRMKSMLLSRYYSYTQGDYCTYYVFSRGNNTVSGYYCVVDGQFYILYDNHFYTKENGIVYQINGTEKIEVQTVDLYLRIPFFITTLVENISKANLMEQKTSYEEYHATAGVDSLLRTGAIKGKIKTDINISYMKDYINISVKEDGNVFDTEIGLSFSMPEAVEYTMIEAYKHKNNDKPVIEDDTSKVQSSKDSDYDFEDDSSSSVSNTE